MPDNPTTSGGGDAPDQPADQLRPNDEQQSTPPPFGDEYRWHGPSRPAYQGPATHAPYGGHYGPYQTTQRPYGSPQSPYGPPQSPPPYAWPYVPPPVPRPPLSPEERRRRTRRGIAFAGVLLLAVGAGIGIGAVIAPTSPATVARTVLSRAIASATKAGSYHYVELSTALGAPDDIKGDAAPNRGQQLIDQRCSPVSSDTTLRTSVFDLRLVDGVVYFRGNVVSVVDELGVAVSHARSLAGTWVKVVKGEKPYETFAVGITTSSNISQLRTAIIPTSSRSVPGSSPPSTEVTGALLKTAKTKQTVGTAALLLDSSTGRPHSLRGSAVISNTERYTLTWTFGGYGEKVQVVAPPHSVSYSSLHATPPKNACS